MTETTDPRCCNCETRLAKSTAGPSITSSSRRWSKGNWRAIATKPGWGRCTSFTTPSRKPFDDAAGARRGHRQGRPRVPVPGSLPARGFPVLRNRPGRHRTPTSDPAVPHPRRARERRTPCCSWVSTTCSREATTVAATSPAMSPRPTTWRQDLGCGIWIPMETGRGSIGRPSRTDMGSVAFTESDTARLVDAAKQMYQTVAELSEDLATAT